MYVWDESVASRGAHEVGSCLLQHLQAHLQPNITTIKLYSDSCGGQNRNIKMTLLLQHFLANEDIISIEQKFFVSGHSYNSYDRNFALIEKEKKLHEIVPTPKDWFNIIENTRKTAPKFGMKQMEKKHIVSTDELQMQITNRKKDVDGEKVSWLKARSLLYKKDKILSVFMTNDDMETQELSLKKRSIDSTDFANCDLLLAYPNGNCISYAKWKDLQELKMLLPENFRSFYENLKYEQGSVNDKDYGMAEGDEDDH